MNALVLGGSGFLGINLVDALLADGVTPRCGRRARSNVLLLRQRRVPLVAADLESVDELTTAMRSCDVVFHAAGHYPRLSLDREKALDTGFRQTRNVLAAARRANVRRLIYVSSTATVAPAAEGASTERHHFNAMPRFGTYHDLKWAMERAVLEARDLDVVVACPGACLGPWDLRIGTSALLVACGRGLNPPHPDGLVNLVDVRDVATALVRMARLGTPPKRVLLSSGNHRLQALLTRLSVRYNVPSPTAPLSSEDAIAVADEEERRAADQGGRPTLSREIVDLIIHAVPIDSRLAEAALGMRWTPLEKTLDAFDAWARRMRIFETPKTEEARP